MVDLFLSACSSLGLGPNLRFPCSQSGVVPRLPLNCICFILFPISPGLTFSDFVSLTSGTTWDPHNEGFHLTPFVSDVTLWADKVTEAQSSLHDHPRGMLPAPCHSFSLGGGLVRGRLVAARGGRG
jgi:hypothetical protein